MPLLCLLTRGVGVWINKNDETIVAPSTFEFFGAMSALDGLSDHPILLNTLQYRAPIHESIQDYSCFFFDGL